MKLTRSSGMLLPIFSLPDQYGIGTIGHQAYKFIDFLKKAGQTYWQILPLGPTSYGDSPYQSFSAHAGNPYFVDLELLKEDGLLKEEDLLPYIDKTLKINYEKIYLTRFNILRQAFNNFDISLLIPFEKENKWLDDYALFMSLKDFHQGKSFLEWEDKYKYRELDSINKFKEENINEINFYKFIQYEFFKQWNNLHSYASKNNIKIIGDIPIYVALDSCDVWSNKEEFLLDEKFNPTFVAGCPPDDFTIDGQLWGNPLYDYDHMKKNNYSWWIERMKSNSKLYDVIRIDHFRGFEAYWMIPYGDETAKNGHWEKGPNTALFKEINKKLGNIEIIAENLGFLTKEVDIMLDTLQYPGMKILEFGFDINGCSDAAPHNLRENMLVYTGTHDNQTAKEWYDHLPNEEKQHYHEYLHFTSPYEAVNELIITALRSPCFLSIIPLWDYLQKDSSARINIPSTLGNNWVWRMEENDMNDDLAGYINKLMKLFKR